MAAKTACAPSEIIDGGVKNGVECTQQLLFAGGQNRVCYDLRDGSYLMNVGGSLKTKR